MSPNSKRSWAISASPCDTCPPPASWPWSSWRPKTWRKWTWEACQVRRIVTACVCGRVCARWLSLWQALLSVITHALQHTLCLSCNANNYPKPSLVTIRFVQKNRTSVEFFTPPPKKPSKFCEDCEETPLFRQNVVLKAHALLEKRLNKSNKWNIFSPSVSMNQRGSDVSLRDTFLSLPHKSLMSGLWSTKRGNLILWNSLLHPVGASQQCGQRCIAEPAVCTLQL